MRSLTGGARRAAAIQKASDGKSLHGANRSKKQQLALVDDALRCARTYTNEALFRRGPEGVAKLRAARRAKYEEAKKKVCY